MTVDITDLGDLSFDWKLVGRVAADIATGGAAELAWNRKARGAIATGAKAIGKAVEKTAAVLACPIAKQFRNEKVAAASAATGYGVAANAAANMVNSICEKGKPASPPPDIVLVEVPWWHNPWKVGALALGSGLVLGLLFRRG